MIDLVMEIISMSEYAAGIVLFNPKLDRLKKNLDAITPQVKVVYCYNNGLADENEIVSLLKLYTNVIMMGVGKNDGISGALNSILNRAIQDNIQWLLTLDQDSVVCCDMVEKLGELTTIEDVGIICPLLKDVRRKNEQVISTVEDYEDIDSCFTSGSFMNVEKTRIIGGYDDYLFIDYVDHDICIRMKKEGYRIIRNNCVVLDHELGDLTPSRLEKVYLKLGEIVKNDAIKKLSYKRAINPIRVYYSTRNAVYMKKKYSNYIPQRIWERKLVKDIISYILRGKKKINIIKAVYRGIRDGRAKYVSPYVIGSSKVNPEGTHYETN